MSSTSTSVHHVASRTSAGERVVGEPDLGQLDAPVAELVPDRVVQEPGHLAERVVGHRLVDRLGRRRGPRQHPALRRAEVAGIGQAALGAVGDRGRPGADDEPRRVPELVREVAGVLELGRPEALVLARASRRGSARTAARRRRTRR